MGSFDYKKPVTIPEHGVCLEMIHKLSIDREGNVSPCVRYDPEGYNIIGSIEDYTLDEIWNSTKRRCWIKHHMLGSRESVPLCETCDFWGVPRG
ncbi:hypothetical protein GWN26_16110 [Candidatus Saccharibacteria bacterium]|nr:hypothetical protein [Candidatus Saccharibacteria bacterium]NIV04586.1 hypothetical protein [Calditrichia bacterium]NIS39131.1 hypothetical protein [Candidatus Saccharibacteria bacterium]NIV73200.1 hypothetical protein [Calditrichia bacterium]NIW00560.1 hypothetical protein [Candidatus Saccharibacteria bacterium]